MACEGLLVGYGGRALLPPINFTLEHGELCAVLGRNGSGKTTLFRTLLGLMPRVGGRVRVCREPVPLAYIPQRSSLDPIVPLLARDVVAMGIQRGRSFLRPWLGRAGRRKVARAMEELGVTDLAARPFARLSEGQKQRVLMARLLAGEPELAVLDEPTAAMDEVAERQTLEQLDRLRHQHGMAVMLVSHHLSAVGPLADRVVFLDRESQRVVTGPPAEVFAHPAFEARYGRAGGDHA